MSDKRDEMGKLTVGLLNDSFPPTIDGVANVTLNYAKIIDRDLGRAVVGTPFYPNVKDDYPFEVIRYPSAYINKSVGYRAGYPFDPVALSKFENSEIDIIHSHCPFVSTVLARILRSMTGAPIVFTYHTKFDIDIEKVTASDSLRKASIKFLLNNIEACDEVWVVSHGAGENLRSLGYKGEYIVMENGVDFERCRAPQEAVDALRRQHDIKSDETVFLFVGRMMWYKGVKLSLDGLKKAIDRGEKFRFILVGDGTDRGEIESYAKEIGLGERCVFAGAVHDREILRSYFTLADLFLFPSTFDTNGIVVREAAACSCPSVLIKDSCAAEGIEDGVTGIIINDDVDGMTSAISRACADHSMLREIGASASRDIYLSWDDAVKKAYERYEIVMQRCKHVNREDEGELKVALTEAVEHLVDDINYRKGQFEDLFWDTRDWIEQKMEQSKDLLMSSFPQNKLERTAKKRRREIKKP